MELIGALAAIGFLMLIYLAALLSHYDPDIMRALRLEIMPWE